MVINWGEGPALTNYRPVAHSMLDGERGEVDKIVHWYLNKQLITGRQKATVISEGGNDAVCCLSPILSPDAKICTDAIIAGDSDGAWLVKSENATS